MGKEESHSFGWTPQPCTSAPLFLHLGSQGPQASLGFFRESWLSPERQGKSLGIQHTLTAAYGRGQPVFFREWISCQSSARKDEVSLHLLLCVHPARLPFLCLRSLGLLGGMPPPSSGQAALPKRNCPWLLLCPLNQGVGEKPCTSPQRTHVLINSCLLEAEK